MFKSAKRAICEKLLRFYELLLFFSLRLDFILLVRDKRERERALCIKDEMDWFFLSNGSCSNSKPIRLSAKKTLTLSISLFTWSRVINIKWKISAGAWCITARERANWPHLNQRRALWILSFKNSMAKAYFEFAHANLKHFKYRDGNICQKLFCISANFQMASLVPRIVVNLLMNKLINQHSYVCVSVARLFEWKNLCHLFCILYFELRADRCNEHVASRAATPLLLINQRRTHKNNSLAHVPIKRAVIDAPNKSIQM